MIINECNTLAQTENMTLIGNEYWFNESHIGNLMKMDKTSMEVSTVWKCNSRGYRLFGDMAVYKDLIIMIPFNHDKIVIYNKTLNTVEEIQVEEDEYCREIGYGCIASGVSSHVFGDSLFIVPTLYPGIIELDLKTWNILKHNIPDSNELIKIKEEQAYFRCSCTDGSKIYAPSCKKSVLYIFDMNNKSFESMDFENDGGFSSALYDDGNIWLAPRNGREVLRYDSTNKTSEKIPIKIDGSYMAADILHIAESIILLPLTDCACKYDEPTNTFTIINETKGYCSEVRNSPEQIFRNAEGRIEDFNNGSNLCIQMDSKCLLEYKKKYQSYLVYARKEKTENLLIQETEVDSLKDFVDYLRK